MTAEKTLITLSAPQRRLVGLLARLRSVPCEDSAPPRWGPAFEAIRQALRSVPPYWEKVTITLEHTSAAAAATLIEQVATTWHVACDVQRTPAPPVESRSQNTAVYTAVLAYPEYANHDYGLDTELEVVRAEDAIQAAALAKVQAARNVMENRGLDIQPADFGLVLLLGGHAEVITCEYDLQDAPEADQERYRAILRGPRPD